MDDDLSALILGVGLRVLARLAHFNLKITAFMIGVWEGFALHQTTAYKPNSFHAYAMQALRFAFDYYFFGKNYLLLGMMTLYLLVTWAATRALVESAIAEQVPPIREPHTRRPRTRPLDPPQYKQLSHQLCHQGSFQHIPPLPTRPRVYEGDHRVRGSEARNVEQILTPQPQPTASLEDDDHISIHEVAPSDSEHYSSYSSAPHSVNDATEPTTEPAFEPTNESATEPPLPALNSETLEESEPIDDVPSKSLALIANNAKIIDKPEYVDPSTPDVGPANAMPTPPLTPSGDGRDDVLSIQIPLLNLGRSPESVIVSESVQAMEDEVGEVVVAVYQANLAAQSDVVPENLIEQADAADVKPTDVDPRSATDAASTLAEIESIVSTINPQSLQKKAESYRSQAQAEVQKRDELLQERLKALAKTQVREAFLLALKARRSQENAISLHRKAERRSYLQNERSYQRYCAFWGGQDLKVIVGRGNHSPGSKPVLRPVIWQAMAKLNQSRLTSHKTALITIKDFRLVLTRIPVGRGRKGMTAEAYLAFECDSFTIIGSIDEAEWGRPKEIHEERSIHEWIGGLRSHGGAGNVLKERKKAREERETVKETNQPPLLQQAKINVTKQTARKTAPSLIKRSSTGDADASPMSEYRRSWKYVENKIADIVTLHIPSSEGSESTSSEGPQPSTSRNAHPLQAALPIKASPVERHDHVSPFSSPLTEWSSTPSPRLKSRSIATRSLSPSPSRDLDDKIITVQSESEQREPPRITSLPSSSAIIPATYPSSSAATPLVSIHPAITRKVPRPMHVLRTTGDHIVAPDSDISYSLSQSQSQSQPPSQHSDVDMDEQRDEADPPQCDEVHAASTSLTEDDSADAGIPPRPPSSRLVVAAVDVDDNPTEPPLPSPPPPIAMDVDEESPIILEYVDEPIPTPPPSPKQPFEQHQLPSTPLKVNDEPNHQNGNHDVVDPLPSLPSKHEHDPKEWLEPSYMRSKKRKLSGQTSATPTTLGKPSTGAAPCLRHYLNSVYLKLKQLQRSQTQDTIEGLTRVATS
ncbi:Proteophosphoglycan ppg [Salix suchowensis]|nr:Proteophosphoglycan ppg [Salix suchowensis]